MSHFTQVESQIINDITSLDKAVKDLGFHLVKGGKCRGYQGTKTCDYVVKLPGQFDLGFNVQSDGKLKMVGDFWGGHISKYLGSNAKKLVQKFNQVRITKDARKKGYSVRPKVLNDGRTKLYIRVAQ